MKDVPAGGDYGLWYVPVTTRTLFIRYMYFIITVAFVTSKDQDQTAKNVELDIESTPLIMLKLSWQKLPSSSSCIFVKTFFFCMKRPNDLDDKG